MNGLSSRERRLVAVLILVALIALVWLAIVSPILTGFADRAAERERLALVQASNARLMQNLPRMRRQAEEQKADRARFRLIAATPGAASEQLKELVSGFVGEVGGEVRALQDIEGPEGQVQVRLEARISARRLPGLLDRIRRAEPLLIVRSAVLSTPGAAGSATSAGQANTGIGNGSSFAPSSSNLDIRLDISASHSPA